MDGLFLPGILFWLSQFSLLLAAVALGVCLVGSYAVMFLLRGALAVTQKRRRLAWLGALCLCFGADVWATHFIAMLAFTPGLPIYYAAGPTWLSILAAVFGSIPGFAVLLYRRHWRYGWALAGFCLGAAIGVMHFVGMSAMRICATQTYNPALVVASLIIGMGLSALALRAKLARPGIGNAGRAAVLLVMAICGLHFTAMAGLTLRPEGLWKIFGGVPGHPAMAGLVALVSLGLLLILLGGAAVDSGIAQRRHEEARRLWHLSRHDDLTGLPNRRHLTEHLAGLAQASLAQAGNSEAVWLFSIGLDRFKPVNDLFGPELADRLLCGVANRLSTMARPDDFLARLEGDVFVLVRTNALLGGAAAARGLGTQLVSALSDCFVLDGVQVQIGASIGIATYPGDGTSAGELLTSADIALRAAKAAGGGQARPFQPQMGAALLRQRQLEQDLYGAMQRNEFLLYYQPLFSARDRHLAGFEALLRWRHPLHGFVSPAEFIPIAEAAGHMQAIGEFVLTQATRDAAQWPKELRVAVNLSPLQLSDPSLPTRVRAAWEQAGLAPSRLELELTEGAMIDSSATVQRNLQMLRAEGVGLAIDDFGTGYSSLAYLHRFDVERLKIDQSFVRALEQSADARIIIRAIIKLGQALGLTVLAEGVETEAQYSFLQTAGCDELQGYLLGRPRPLGELELFVELEPAPPSVLLDQEVSSPV